MSEISNKTSKLKGYLAFAFVILFAAFLLFRFSPIGAKEQKPLEKLAYSGICAKQDFSNSENERDVIPLTLELKSGKVEIELWCDVAPEHVDRIATLASDGFYDGIVFHRVIEEFMAQTGDPTGTGMGGSDLADLKAEFSSEPFVRGTLGMARSNNPNSANSQFFITFGDAAFLNNNYTVFGQVVSGMEFVDKIKKGDSNENGVVNNPDAIITMTINLDG